MIRIDNQTFSNYKISGKSAGKISIHDSGIIDIEGGKTFDTDKDSSSYSKTFKDDDTSITVNSRKPSLVID